MSLTFPAPPTGVDPTTIQVVLFGRDAERGEDVECRISHNALMDRCGACGQTDSELLRAFNEHREMIEKAANHKYAAGQVEHLDDRIVVYLESTDL